jgi:hypothetical protein
MNQRWVHLILWGCYAAFLFWVFFDLEEVAWRAVMVGIVVAAHVGTYYLHERRLMPMLAEQRRYTVYGAWLLILLLGNLLVMGAVVALGIRGMPPPPPMPAPPRPAMMPGLGRAVSLQLFWTLAIIFLSASTYQTRRRREQEQAALVNAQRVLEADLGRLRAQVNPHFLMNALNNIYALTELQSPEAPQAILNLSNMMQYVLYEGSRGWTSIARECDYIRHFVAFQCLREEGMAARVRLDLPAPAALRGEVIPMTLVTFVENAFKHSGIEDHPDGWIDIALSCTGGQLQFRCANSLPATAHIKAETGGIGIPNVRQRLAYLYPDTHVLRITHDHRHFAIDLQIPIHHAPELPDRR